LNSQDPFSPEKLAALRAEIKAHGLTVDKFLLHDADAPTFGINLACAWPFPESLRQEYERMARRFAALGPWLYVYPFEFTHITLVTFISFARHVRPAPELVKKLEGKTEEILETLSPLFVEAPSPSLRPPSPPLGERAGARGIFTLQPQAPVLTRAAGILPMLNPGGEVPRLRQQVSGLLQHNAPLYQELVERGLSVPGIIHSTVMRFIKPPPDLNQFLAAFDEIAAETKLPALQVSELLLTSETKPYMRGGKLLSKFRLGN
jgi:hypothetical protein